MSDGLNYYSREYVEKLQKERDDLRMALGTKFGILQVVKDIYREIHPGGCRWLSVGGDSCVCFLCRMDATLPVSVGISGGSHD